MNEIKQLPELEACGWDVLTKRTDVDPAGWLVADCSAAKERGSTLATLFAAAPNMSLVLEMIAADADAGVVMIPSGLRLTIDAALIKAGRKAAPEPVRHVTIAGVDR
ncbi:MULTISPECIES: hypothetical protein [Burkholderia]|uniref:hypothetical protein n=1 Tax=Burkholderia TaxID=32008 RepID=UPI00075943DF|nr:MULTISPECIES: hypothetical protein [Burkholderia]AOJ69356.1 hypothetical protein WS78_11785 [Burkholderia savannae]KVG37475.1 hypothetical protein WS77_02015 [Burkholderia sp. MSMB0265]KVG88261.1 hypothetical protein WS81_25210 [Burkholderia sp. MSMB2040]KVG93812.1 hypothetical protein WS82_08705 [Burkholderia sp. MSMB2041]KVH01064.1 hypothetical protein WS83_20265 [Burkholderia sp. MSMB2042]